MVIENERPETWASQNPRSTKSYGGGKSTSPKLSGLWFVGLWILTSACSTQAAPPRTLWLFQQLGRISVPRTQTHVLELETEVDHIGDTPSVAARLAVPVGPVEIRAKGSQRLFLDLTDAGRARHDLSRNDETAVGIEVARHFFSSRGNYGRFAAEFLTFRPSRQSFIGILVHTGAVDTPHSPWAVALSLQVRFATEGIESNLGISGESERVVWSGPGSKIRLGGAVSWCNRMKDGPEVVPTEHGVLTLGPSASWDGALGELKARLGFRMWLDRDVPTTQTAMLSEFDPPALNVFWTYRL